ncbi:gem-associated protein 4 isoform 1-T1 [Menidia menidia]
MALVLNKGNGTRKRFHGSQVTVNFEKTRVRHAAVLQGAFLQADKLCHPSSLSSIQKADWSQVGRPVLQAVREICGQEDTGLQANPEASTWRKKIVCTVWLKLLSTEAEEDVEEAWRENPFFCLTNSLPEVNTVVLMELIKSTGAAQIFASCLLKLPVPQICAELDRLTGHMMCDPTGEDDLRFFLEVWWELWQGQHEHDGKEEEEEKESIEMLFAKQFARLASKPSGFSARASKRLKLDAADSAASPENPDVLRLLLCALHAAASRFSSADLCSRALSVSLDACYTSFLINKEVVVPAKERLRGLCELIGEDDAISPELIRKLQRDLRASSSPSRFKPEAVTRGQALETVSELARAWREKGLLGAEGGPAPAAPRLRQSARRVLAALDDDREGDPLGDLLKSLAAPSPEVSPKTQLQVVSTVIAHRLDDQEDFAALFASEASWAHFDRAWLDCLEKNPAPFRRRGPLMGLASSLVDRLHTEGCDLSRCRKLMKALADIFSALPSEDMNEALAAMLGLSSRGFFGEPAPAASAVGFEQELNMAFNCIIRGGAASDSPSQGNLSTAVTLVARMAFQNPEATLRHCCHSAVFNKGGFSLIAKILQQLPGLRSPEDGTEEGGSLLCRCLRDTVGAKSLSAGDRDQFLRFLGLLMTPHPMKEGEEEQQSCLTPREVVDTFVLPNLSDVGSHSSDLELSLQLLHAALSVDVQTPALSPHWVMDCSPFPLLFVLAQLYDQTLRYWQQKPDGTILLRSMDTKELLVSVLGALGRLVGAEVSAAPATWSRPLSWLYSKAEPLDWTARFHLKPVWGQHFKNEAPASLLTVCELPEQEWSCVELPQYGQGTGLLAWMECCALSDPLQSTMLSGLSLDQRNTHHVGMFSKGALVALTQSLPWCCVSQWGRLLRALRELIASGRLDVPFSLEYVDFLPLLDLRGFSCELRLSVLLLRVFQLLCGSSCSHWLSAEGWAHAGRLYAHAARELVGSVKAKLPLPAPGSRKHNPDPTTAPNKNKRPLEDAGNSPEKSQESRLEEMEAAPGQEVLFVLSQLFCHVQHVQVMMPGGQCEPLFLCSLEILSHYEAVMAAFPDSCSHLESDNTRHFFSTITDNLSDQKMKAALLQKIAQLVSSAA